MLLAQGRPEQALQAWPRAPTDDRCVVGIALLCLITSESLPEEIDDHVPRLAHYVAETARRSSGAPNQGPGQQLTESATTNAMAIYLFFEPLRLPAPP